MSQARRPRSKRVSRCGDERAKLGGVVVWAGPGCRGLLVVGLGLGLGLELELELELELMLPVAVADALPLLSRGKKKIAWELHQCRRLAPSYRLLLSLSLSLSAFPRHTARYRISSYSFAAGAYLGKRRVPLIVRLLDGGQVVGFLTPRVPLPHLLVQHFHPGRVHLAIEQRTVRASLPHLGANGLQAKKQYGFS
jgi:hypothetical protein